MNAVGPYTLCFSLMTAAESIRLGRDPHAPTLQRALNICAACDGGEITTDEMVDELNALTTDDGPEDVAELIAAVDAWLAGGAL